MKHTRTWVPRLLLVGASLLTGGAVALVPGTVAAQDEVPKVAVKGRILGGRALLNPVWTEAKDPNNHRYTFRAPSPTVGANAKVLTAYLPKELAIVALSDAGGKASGAPRQVHISGGRTTPVTVVVPEGQNVQFVNHDPFPHKLYDVKATQGGMPAEDTLPKAQRIWKPPAPGTYEIRDKLVPSLRSWVVVEPKAAGVGYPTIKNEFTVEGLEPGPYQLQGYHNGEAVGDKLAIVVRPMPDLQPIGKPLVVGKPKKKKKKAAKK
jgi:hypothetical protein